MGARVREWVQEAITPTQRHSCKLRTNHIVQNDLLRGRSTAKPNLATSIAIVFGSRTTLLAGTARLRSSHAPIYFARLSRSPKHMICRVPMGTGTPTELYAFPDEAHIKMQPRHWLAIYERNLDWFRYWLQGERDPDPAKAGQYERWDKLSERQCSRRTNAQPVAAARVRSAR